MLTSKYAAPAYRDRARRRREGRGRRRAHDPLRPEGHARRHDLQRSARLRVFSRKWALGPGRHSRSRSTRSSPSTRSPAARTRSTRGRFGPRASSFKRNPDYWARDLGVRRGFFNFDRIVYRYYRTSAVGARGVQGRRVRHLQGVRRAQLGAPAQGRRSGTTAASRRTCSTTASGRACRRTCSTCAGRCSRTSARARGARLHLRLRDDQPSTSLYKRHRQPVLQLRLRRRGPAVAGRAAAARAVPRASCRRRCSARRIVAPRTTRDPNALRENLMKARDAARAGRLEARRPTASCATPRASRSRSST